MPSDRVFKSKVGTEPMTGTPSGEACLASSPVAWANATPQLPSGPVAESIASSSFRTVASEFFELVFVSVAVALCTTPIAHHAIPTRTTVTPQAISFSARFTRAVNAAPQTEQLDEPLEGRAWNVHFSLLPQLCIVAAPYATGPPVRPFLSIRGWTSRYA